MVTSEYIKRKEQQFLLHSFLYYVLNESLISDTTYDYICKDLVKYKSSPDLQYPEIIKHLDESASGYYIKKYPDPIITKAFHVLFERKRAEGMKIPFPDFVKRYGFRINE